MGKHIIINHILSIYFYYAHPVAYMYYLLGENYVLSQIIPLSSFLFGNNMYVA